MAGLMSKLTGWMGDDSNKMRLAGLGQILMAADQGKAADISPYLGAIQEQKQAQQFRDSLGSEDMMGKFSSEERSFLAGLPPQIAQKYIAERIFAQPEPTTFGWQTMPDGTLVRTDSTGGITPMGQFGKPEAGTSAMQNYQFLLEQGLSPQEAQERAFSGGVNVNLGDQMPGLGKLSPDHTYVMDPETGRPRIDPETGLPQAVPVPGSPAAREIEQQREKEAGRQATTERSTRTVLRAVDRALEALPEITQGDGPAGAAARIAKMKIPGTAEYNMNLQVQDFLSNVGIDQLNAMRANSPTGGALGNVTEKQQARLEQVLGSFDLAQSPQVLKENLSELNNIYLEITYGTEEERAQAVAEGRLDPELNEQVQSMFRESGYDQFGRRKSQSGEQSGQKRLRFNPQTGELE